MTDSYVPTLLNGVLNFTNKDKLQYVGFSNGCRAALSSLEKNKFNSSKVETFVAVGCPGSFEGFSPGASLIDQENADKAINKLEKSNRTHFAFGESVLARFITPSQSSFSESNKISLNLLKQYLIWINSNNDSQPGNLSMDNFAIIQGNGFITSDGIVTTSDEKAIYNNIKLNNPINSKNIKRYFSIMGYHFPILIIPSIADTTKTKSLIDKTLNKQSLNFYQQTFELKESETKTG